MKQFMIVVTNTSTYRHNIFHQESLKRQLKLILDIDPKTPGESLAKELRQVGKNILSRHHTFVLEISPFMTDPWQKNLNKYEAFSLAFGQAIVN